MAVSNVKVVDGCVIVAKNELVYVVVMIWPEAGIVLTALLGPEAPGVEGDWPED